MFPVASRPLLEYRLLDLQKRANIGRLHVKQHTFQDIISEEHLVRVSGACGKRKITILECAESLH